MIGFFIKVLQLIVLVVIAGLLFYAWTVAIPEQTALFKACEEKILCQNKMLTGKVCERYLASTYGINFTTIP